MNSEILYLIDLAIADGNITEKERAVILRKALALGEDPDEVEMILDGKLHQTRSSDENSPTIANGHDPALGGQVTKCPECNATIGAFVTKCPDCGHEFRHTQASSTVQKLYDELQRIEEQERSRSGKPSWLDQLGDYGFQINQSVASRQVSAIAAFPIPNTKEDLLEFLTIAVSEAKKKVSFVDRLNNGREHLLQKAWLAKSRQLITKARLSMKDDKSTLAEIEEYAKQLDH